jgi:SAM-dependent methyltransferase
MSDATRCRSCHGDRVRQFLSLGDLPLPDAFLRHDQLEESEPRFPLDVAFCEQCSLVQLLGDVPAEQMFVDNYLYFSSYSDLILEHSRIHAEGLIERYQLDERSLVVELASNDGYLLRNFADAHVPVLGIDPAPEPAAAARELGIETIQEFFGLDLARRLVAGGQRADVIIANNVMAHVPDLNDFVAGIAALLTDDGVVTVENPWVGALIAEGQFDTIYHEHVCYYSTHAVEHLARRHGLFVNDVEEFPGIHGGTLRWHLSRTDARSDRLAAHLEAEERGGITTFSHFEDFGAQVEAIRTALRSLLTGLKDRGHSIAAYGAAAKGTVMLNYVGIDRNLVDFVVDRNVHKHGHFMPGVHIPILDAQELLERNPDYTLILAWNFTDEIIAQQAEYVRRGGRFIRPVPRPEVLQ